MPDLNTAILGASGESSLLMEVTYGSNDFVSQNDL